MPPYYSGRSSRSNEPAGLNTNYANYGSNIYRTPTSQSSRISSNYTLPHNLVIHFDLHRSMDENLMEYDYVARKTSSKSRHILLHPLPHFLSTVPRLEDFIRSVGGNPVSIEIIDLRGGLGGHLSFKSVGKATVFTDILRTELYNYKPTVNAIMCGPIHATPSLWIGFSRDSNVIYEYKLQALFEKVGDLTFYRAIRSLRCCFATYSSIKEAIYVRNLLYGYEIDGGITLNIDFCTLNSFDKRPRSPSPNAGPSRVKNPYPTKSYEGGSNDHSSTDHIRAKDFHTQPNASHYSYQTQQEVFPKKEATISHNNSQASSVPIKKEENEPSEAPQASRLYSSSKLPDASAHTIETAVTTEPSNSPSNVLRVSSQKEDRETTSGNNHTVNIVSTQAALVEDFSPVNSSIDVFVTDSTRNSIDFTRLATALTGVNQNISQVHDSNENQEILTNASLNIVSIQKQGSSVGHYYTINLDIQGNIPSQLQSQSNGAEVKSSRTKSCNIIGRTSIDNVNDILSKNKISIEKIIAEADKNNIAVDQSTIVDNMFKVDKDGEIYIANEQENILPKARSLINPAYGENKESSLLLQELQPKSSLRHPIREIKEHTHVRAGLYNDATEGLFSYFVEKNKVGLAEVDTKTAIFFIPPSLSSSIKTIKDSSSQFGYMVTVYY